jgi:hypothetical protein
MGFVAWIVVGLIAGSLSKFTLKCSIIALKLQHMTHHRRYPPWTTPYATGDGHGKYKLFRAEFFNRLKCFRDILCEPTN